MYKIAIIESEHIIREGLCALLANGSGFTVDFQASAPVALFRQAWLTPPDLVLLDMMMPKNYGIEVIKEIKKRWPATKILIFTLKRYRKRYLRCIPRRCRCRWLYTEKHNSTSIN
ncbi:response regulator transcription factor [Methylobacter sp. G7]|uniref:response regulator n=1 Tax=Methylobacter sp. G7 TaxID=3230117 RepID=UPI003D802FED